MPQAPFSSLPSGSEVLLDATNDSLLLAAVDVFGIDALATNDSDFDNIPWLTVYKPTDVV